MNRVIGGGSARLLSFAAMIAFCGTADFKRALADTVVLPASQDSTIYSQSNQLSNGAGSHFFAGTTAGGDVRRALLRFDIAGSLPAGSTINSVTVTLFMSRSISGNAEVSLHRVLSDWGEGSSDAPGQEGGGAVAQTNDATWEYRFYDPVLPATSRAWARIGGDFAAGASATRTIGGFGSYSWTSTADLVADVQACLDIPNSCYGWFLVGPEGRVLQLQEIRLSRKSYRQQSTFLVHRFHASFQ